MNVPNYVDYKAQLSANGHSRAVMGGVSYPDGYVRIEVIRKKYEFLRFFQ